MFYSYASFICHNIAGIGYTIVMEENKYSRGNSNIVTSEHYVYRCPVSNQTLTEEVFNVWTHRLGLYASITGLIVMVTFASIFGGALHIVATAGFCISLILLFLASMSYHDARRIERKKMLRVLDHMAIFLVIAGSYTPFMLVIHKHPVSWPLFWIIWSMAVLGVGVKIFFTGRFQKLSTMGYLAMGWAVTLALGPLREELTSSGFTLLMAGGISYTVGAIFYSWKKLPFQHVIWHVFVLGGVTCHWFSVLTIVLTT